METNKRLENLEVKLLMLRKRLGQAEEQIKFALEDVNKLKQNSVIEEEKTK